MWSTIARLIIRFPFWALGTVLLASAFMGYHASQTKISHQFGRLLPVTDSTYIDYENFKQSFGEAGNTVVIVANPKEGIFNDVFLAQWHAFANTLRELDGVKTATGIDGLVTLKRNDEEKKFYTQPIWDEGVSADSLSTLFRQLPFYHGLFTDAEKENTLMVLRLDPDIIYEERIIPLIEEIKWHVKAFESATNVDLYTSGLPYIRMANTLKIKREVYLFIALALSVTALILFLFLRSWRATFISLSIVCIGVVWSFGLISALGYEITLLSSLIPPIVIVIGIANCIFLINKYHSEYRQHHNRVLALQRMISKIGNATFLTNATTSLGFAAFILTNSIILVEFGVVAAINIFVVYILSLIIIPAAYQFSPAPQKKHYQHFDRRWLRHMVFYLDEWTQKKRPVIYVVTVVMLVLAFTGMSRLYSSGSLTDDFSHRDPVYKNVKYIESKFDGVMPLEILIDTKKKRSISQVKTLEKIDALEQKLEAYEALSTPLSVARLARFAKQGYYGGNPEFYEIPTRQERNFIYSYIPRDPSNESILYALTDTNQQVARISLQIRDLPTPEMRTLLTDIERDIETVFPAEEFDVTITGASVLFVKGTDYLIRNLLISLSLAIGVILIVMAVLFRSWKMIVVAIFPNILPLLLTAGVMGFAGIPLKPSTILIFSIAFGISVDDTIHFLAKYRQELAYRNWNIVESVRASLRETGISMFYTSIVLFFGFAIFTASSFGGTVALGMLVSFTLIVAIGANLLLLPSLILSLERFLTNEDFKSPPVKILDEEND
ncbi:MAG: MMPL family transporter [Cryomorphaceae bacterium]|nr:MMPL family transporter [Cryomorphaceae bacterium]